MSKFVVKAINLKHYVNVEVLLQRQVYEKVGENEGNESRKSIVSSFINHGFFMCS